MSEAPKGQPTQRELIRQAFEALGFEAKPLAVAEWIREHSGRQVKTQTISVEKNWMKKEYHQEAERGHYPAGTNANGAERIQENTEKTVAEVLSLLKRLKVLANEAGGVEKLREYLDCLS